MYPQLTVGHFPLTLSLDFCPPPTMPKHKIRFGHDKVASKEERPKTCEACGKELVIQEGPLDDQQFAIWYYFGVDPFHRICTNCGFFGVDTCSDRAYDWDIDMRDAIREIPELEPLITVYKL